MKIIKAALLAVMLAPIAATAQRTETTLTDGWQFSHDGNQWQSVRVPHDWAIAGPFDKKWDLQKVAIKENGETKATEKSGRSGSLPWPGEGIYKRRLTLPDGCEHAELIFDGAMSEPVVYANGKEAGRWAYGYNAFRIDLTPYINQQPIDIEVRLKNLPESSRWYPGGGLYRPVKLVATKAAHIDPWGLAISTLEADSATAKVCIDAQVHGYDPNRLMATEIAIIDHRGHVQAAAHTDVEEDGTTHSQLTLKTPQLWSPETPYIYKVRARLYQDNRLVDEQIEKTGIRTISISPEHGFTLNSKRRDFKGVCLHHDLGPIGAAVSKAAIVRQIRLLKEMGCDAIRTSHNMPSTLQMEVCDSMGMLVMAESFDSWKQPKVKNGYNRFWDEWWQRDIENLIRCHRNHPSIVIWSVGNEVPEQWKPEGAERMEQLVNLCHKLDPTRPVTAGSDQPEGALKCGFLAKPDIPGFNYRTHLYERLYPQLPQGILLGSETASTVSSRGIYKFPVETAKMKNYPDGQCNGYDTECCSWSNLPDDDWRLQDDHDWTIGEFVWTGFDYLGEPTPYDTYWPSRSSYFGIFDLAGLPKDRYWLYRSHWRTDDHTLHLLPHWTWPERRGETTPVYCYTDFPTAELFVNGKSQGRKTKQKESRLDRYRLRWNDVKYEPGELLVVAYDENGREAARQTVRTAGKPKHLKLESARATLTPDPQDLAYITVSLTDADGTLCPTATDELEFRVTGAAEFKAACNGDATSLVPFVSTSMPLFAGQLVVTIAAKDQPGIATLEVTDKSNKRISAKLTIPVK